MKFNSKSRFSILFYLFAAAILVSGVVSCVKDNFELNKLTATEWDPNFAVPLVYSSMTIGDMINTNSGFVQVDADNFCSIVYKGNLFSIQAKDLIQIPNNQPAPIVASLNSSQISAFGSAGTITVPYSQNISFNTGNNGPKIDSMIFKSGAFDIHLTSTFQYSGQIKVMLPTAVKNGVSFSKTVAFTYSGGVPVTSISSSDLAGYKFDLTNGGTTFNEFPVNVELTLSGSGNPISSGDQVSVELGLNNLAFARIYGDIGQLSISPDVDTVDISIFKNTLGAASLTLVDPSIKVWLTNSYGVPIAASISPFEGYTPGGSSFPITSNGGPLVIPIQSPNLSQIGMSLTDSFSLDNSNSNLSSVISNTPKMIIYKLNTQTNPSGGSVHNNFILDTSSLKVDMEVNLPLYGSASNFVLVDTIPFKFTNTVPEQVDWALIRTYNSNGFPFEVNLQVYFTDSLYNKLDSLIVPSQMILQSAVVSPITGIVTSPTEKTLDFLLTQTRLNHLTGAQYLIVNAAASTTNNGATNVKIYSNYKLDFKMGIQVQVKAKI